MTGACRRSIGVVRIGAIVGAVAALAGCSRRPLPARGDGSIGAGPGPGEDGATPPTCGSGGARMELIGAPVLVLDSPPTSGNLYTTLLWTGEEYLFVWRIFGGDAILMQRIDASGQGIGGNIRLREYESACDVAWGGSRLAAAWIRANGSKNDLMFQTFDGLGRPLIDPVVLRTSADIGIDGSVIYGPRIVPIAGGFAIAWNEKQVAVATVDLEGHAMHQPVTAGPRTVGTPPISLASAEGRIIVGFVDSHASTLGVAFASTFSTDLTPLGDVSLDDQALAGGLAQVVATDAGFLALWARGDPSDPRVRVARLDRDGANAAIGEMAPPVVGSYRYLSPAVWNGDHVVVLWDSGGSGAIGLELSRYAPSGERQGTSIDLPVAGPAGRLYTTAHDGTIAFTWTEEIGGGYEVYLQRARSCP